ncbi:M20/M25/M40 family metallo-hydrolase [Nevskia sp.]|uniref:M20/M25/M40 family metallo-hydrolase n=1 Tax=Nevskia sp. TaxID=1929292 RepID=UPI0025F1842E|nr:M20/M25/M40 family metallo-hydrolase [Nevskia sp.]
MLRSFCRFLAAAAVLSLISPLAWPLSEAEIASHAEAAALARIREAAMADDYAYERLAALTDTIGPRLSGSPQAAAAVDQVAAEMRALGAVVQLQPVKVPHWVRGAETAELTAYPGRPAGVTQKLVLTALGGSTATPKGGLEREVVVIRSFAELDARAAELRDRIVLISIPFDQQLADNGHAGIAYGQGGEPRFRGPAAAAKHGAAAVLVRSVGGANFRLPHTGATVWSEGGTRLPAAALTVEDALLIERLSAKGPVRMKLLLTPQTLPDADSHNVIADWPGREKPDEVVVVSGHLDSWDLGTGAIDDGAGIATAMATIRLMKELGLQPRRTIRLVAFMNEENGTRGAKAYFEAVQKQIGTQSAAIESDAGAGRPLGIDAYVTAAALKRMQPLFDALKPIGATVPQRSERPTGVDISPLQRAGVPGFEPLLDTRHYFDYHHTAADTLDKVEPDHLRRQLAVMAMLAYWLAEQEQPLERQPVIKE